MELKELIYIFQKQKQTIKRQEWLHVILSKQRAEYENKEELSTKILKKVEASFDRNKTQNKYRFTEEEVEQQRTKKEGRIEIQRKAREKMIANSPAKKKILIY